MGVLEQIPLVIDFEEYCAFYYEGNGEKANVDFGSVGGKDYWLQGALIRFNYFSGVCHLQLAV